MKVGNKVLNNVQSNFVKELMGDVYMTDTRAQAQLDHLSKKYDADIGGMLDAATASWSKKNAEFKRLEAVEAAKDQATA